MPLFPIINEKFYIGWYLQRKNWNYTTKVKIIKQHRTCWKRQCCFFSLSKCNWQYARAEFKANNVLLFRKYLSRDFRNDFFVQWNKQIFVSTLPLKRICKFRVKHRNAMLGGSEEARYTWRRYFTQSTDFVKVFMLALCNKAKQHLKMHVFARNICTKIHKIVNRNVKFARQTWFYTSIWILTAVIELLTAVTNLLTSVHLVILIRH